MFRLLGPERDPEHRVLSVLRHDTLPPNGHSAHERSSWSGHRSDDEFSGLLSSSRPSRNTLRRPFVLRPRWQRRGVGREIVEELEWRAARTGYREIRVAVGLRNWPALRFWVALRYDRIAKIGDPKIGNKPMRISNSPNPRPDPDAPVETPVLEAAICRAGETGPSRIMNRRPTSENPMHRIAIIGAGFAALTAAQRIRALAPTADITLVAPRPEFRVLSQPDLDSERAAERRGSAPRPTRFLARHKLTSIRVSSLD